MMLKLILAMQSCFKRWTHMSVIQVLPESLTFDSHGRRAVPLKLSITNHFIFMGILP